MPRLPDSVKAVLDLLTSILDSLLRPFRYVLNPVFEFLTRIPDRLRMILLWSSLCAVLLLNSNNWELAFGQKSNEARLVMVIIAWAIMILLFADIAFWKRLLRLTNLAQVLLCPVYLFPMLSFAHFSLAFLPLAPWGFGANYRPDITLSFVVLIGISSMTLGCQAGRELRMSRREKMNLELLSSVGNLNLTIGALLFGIGGAATIAYFFGQGIPLLDFAARNSIDPMINGLIGLLMIGSLFMLVEIKDNTAYWLLAGIMALIFLVKTVRYDIFVAMLAILVVSLFRNKIPIKQILVIALFFIAVVALIGGWKTSIIAGDWLHVSQLDMVIYSPYVSADQTYRDMSRVLQEVMPNGLFNGQMISDTLLPILPGHQTSSTVELSNLVLPYYPGYSSISLHFSSYAYMAADFGWKGVIFMSIIFGSVTGMLFERAVEKRTIYLAMYAVIFGWLLQGIFATIYRPEVFLLNIAAVGIIAILQINPTSFYRILPIIRPILIKNEGIEETRPIKEVLEK